MKSDIKREAVCAALAIAFIAAPIAARAQSTTPCPRPAAGSVVSNPQALYSKNGVLTVNLSYNSDKDADGRTLYCFTTPDGTESPTFHVRPGDHLVINVKNNLPTPTVASSMQMATNAATQCGAATMDSSSMNIHYHGTNTSPTCHHDEVIHTTINSRQSFTL